ncbi:alpha-L-rhamnosidase [Aspergillus homomorphus CBS 101889]|uniref:alpha-L-rhamnosidase n=1 Tax=Aspergillus homomorphus (strain CBS 101889) TaxID=1450537 RepID=A0A395HJX0_ASPHC|nr:hypothetical protein BO97DRAFT_223000 [Aspergillus homomorphus CBS 101889]RAL08211.1 hypothetical protein BO97DRAFT_223000 [Aspergillus homomorphus CBS 101889]
MTEIDALRFGHSQSGLGIQCATPRLSWRTSSPNPNVHNWTQTAYEIALKAPGESHQADDGGQVYHVDSANSTWVPWPGPPLRSRERMQVRVRAHGTWIEIEDDGGTPEKEQPRQQAGFTAWSAWGTVECALLSKSDWAAVPIVHPAVGDAHTPLRPVVLRKTFDLPPDFGHVERARLYVTGLGLYRVYLNGKRVGDHELAPGWASYSHRLAYQVHDVSAAVAARNVLGVEVAEGWYAGRLGFNGGRRCLYGERIGALVQLEVVGARKEEVLRVVSDGSWRCNFSSLVRSEIYDGELYDMRQELGNWLGDPDYEEEEEAAWRPVVSLPLPAASLVVPRAPPVRVTQRVAPRRLFATPSGRLVLDFGQNLVGKLHVRRLDLPADAEVRFTHAEVMENGELGVRPLRQAKCTDVIVSSGDILTEWSPKFTFHGFRFVQVDGWDPRASSLAWQENIAALVLHTDFAAAGDFECSHDAINQLHCNARWSMRGNFVSIPTDCPQRDERLGWTGDIQVFSPSATVLYNCEGMLADWMEDVAAEQHDDGGVPPLVVPNVLQHVWPPMPQAVWDDVVIILPWVLYQASGDAEILRRQYPSMTAWLDQGVRRGDDGLWDPDHWQLGDWLDPQAPSDEPGDGRTSGVLVADAYLVHVTRILAQISKLLNQDADAAHYQEQSDRLLHAFHAKYVTPKGLVAGDTQTAYALVVVFGLIDSQSQRKTISHQLSRLVRMAKFRVATGFAGTPIILQALRDSGNLSLAYRMLLEDKCPSWLYPISQGATTIWERWDSLLPDGSINPGEMTSFNHYALGSVVQWLHETVGGLIPREPGWKSVLVSPQPGGPLTYAAVSHDCAYGRWSCRWDLVPLEGAGEDEGEEEGKCGQRINLLKVELDVPLNATAIVRLGSEAEKHVGSGHYRFQVPFVPLPYPLEPIAPFITNPGQGL